MAEMCRLLGCREVAPKASSSSDTTPSLMQHPRLRAFPRVGTRGVASSGQNFGGRGCGQGQPVCHASHLTMAPRCLCLCLAMNVSSRDCPSLRAGCFSSGHLRCKLGCRALPGDCSPRGHLPASLSRTPGSKDCF